MVNPITHISSRKVLTLFGLVLVLLLSFNCSFLTENLPLAASVSIIKQPVTKRTFNSFSVFLNNHSSNKAAFERIIFSDDFQPDGFCKVAYFFFKPLANIKNLIDAGYNNVIVQKRHLYILYCSWRHFTTIK